ncbi:membrane protein [Salmonella enterica subsp. enterica]|uniref:Membrane protein n=1 Tax=Salmonella enterica I TaxID=59201 RepID=A0A3S4K3Q9_SALET|nr:membrane protein [Salmonella enterica subsp. enterica]
MASINEIHNLMTTARAEHPVVSSAIAEFIQTYKQAREDSDDGIRESAAFIARALQEHARGWLDDDDMIIPAGRTAGPSPGYSANNAQIALGSRIRSTVIRLIDIALALLVGAL